MGDNKKKKEKKAARKCRSKFCQELKGKTGRYGYLLFTYKQLLAERKRKTQITLDDFLIQRQKIGNTEVHLQKLWRWRQRSCRHLSSLRGVSPSLNRTVTCMVLKANDRRTSCPCHDEFRGPRSDYVRQVALVTTTSKTIFFMSPDTNLVNE
ncbi:secernin-1 [Trichonephila clavipes]|nr:secernin-1 [Trichonephila clavipes]